MASRNGGLFGLLSGLWRFLTGRPAPRSEPKRERGRPPVDLADPQARPPAPPIPAAPAPPVEAAEPPAAAPSPPARPPEPQWAKGWNPAVPKERRIVSRNARLRRELVGTIVIHIAGASDFATVRRTFTRGETSAHYVIDTDGALYQFVSEHGVAFHAGIDAATHALYAMRDGSWRRFKRYFGWHKGYPADAVFLDAKLRKTGRGGAHFVARQDGAAWPDYGYFDARWGAERPAPANYRQGVSPNENSIGIEIVSLGAAKPSPAVYTDAMYQTLAALVADLCQRHNLKRELGPVCGHEDVNPVARWGWDPNQGFDWDRALGK